MNTNKPNAQASKAERIYNPSQPKSTFKSFSEWGEALEVTSAKEQAQASQELYDRWDSEDRRRSRMNRIFQRNDGADEALEKNFRASGDARMWQDYSRHVNRNR